MRPSFDPTRPCSVEYCCGGLARLHRIGVLLGVVRALAVRAPVALVVARGRVIHDDALVDIAVGDEQLVGLRLDVEVGRSAQVIGIVAALVHARLADGEQVLALLRELHHVHAVARAHPDEAVVVDVDAVLLVEPRVALTGAAPGPQHLALGIQLQHRRRRDAAVGDGRLHRRADLLRREARRHVDHPQVVAVVHEQPADVAEDPVVRERRRPRGIDLVDRQLVGGGRSRAGFAFAPCAAAATAGATRPAGPRWCVHAS